jgi:transposase InsO family protein
MVIEALKQINLVEFMSRCWQTQFRREGESYVALSPFRRETKASLYVNRMGDGHWVYFDHGGGHGGTIIDAVMAYDGHSDVGLAVRTARRMVEEAGLLPPGFPEGETNHCRPDLEGLLSKLSANDPGPARDYLLGRGIALWLVDDLIGRGVVVLNRLGESNYCCFAVRDAEGRLRGLFNRKIDGPAERERFLLGEQHPFCSDWPRLAKTLRVHVCEAIIDALSVLTLEPGACVLALPGVHYDLERLDCPPPPARLVEAFDGDEAGRGAAGRLRRRFPGHEIERFELYGAHDVNELLCRGQLNGAPQPGKLSVADRVEIALSEEPSRELAKRYGVHHSRICDIRSEAREMLARTWEERRPGRKAVPEPPVDVEKLRRDMAEQKRQFELLTMRNEWLELQVKIWEGRTVEEVRAVKESKKKRPGAAEAGEMIELIERQAVQYPRHNAGERLGQAGLTPSGYRRLREGLAEETVRESAIPEGDIQAAVEFFVAHPQVGASKAHVSLIDQEKACLSASNLNVVKRTLSEQVEETYKRRKEEEKLLEARLREELLARREKEEYQHFRAEYPNHVWSIDFSQIKFLGMTFMLCVVYDEYSQDYLAVEAGLWAGHELAAASFQKALSRSPRKPDRVRRDNGLPFLTEDFQRLLERDRDCPIPPGSPWYNGSLESCNTSLKAAIKTTGMQEMAAQADVYRDARQEPEAALAVLCELTDRVRVMLNEEISRLKHRMPPAKVFDGQGEATRERHQAFVARKRQERLERMAEARANPDGRRAPKTLFAKIETIARRIIGKMGTNVLYVLNEALHHRFRLFET